MTRTPLSADEVAAALAGLPGWTHDGERIRRTVTLPSFGAAIEYVNAVAAVAEELDHHPDIDVRYRDVTLTCWTHTTGGVTTADVDLARRAEALLTTRSAG
jgi:4a-hydroxytetrahydrobiopterin dehydratase